MKIHEYQAKEILAKYGVPVPRGGVASTPAEAKKIAAELGGVVVIKAQVYAGGRGKGGGIKTAQSPDEAEKLASQIIGMRLVTHQTAPEGVMVDKVLVEDEGAIARELYLGIVIDSGKGLPVIMASEAGGMDIEEVAAKTPEKILKEYIDPMIGFQPFLGRRLAFGLNLEAEQIREAAQLIGNLYRLFQERDCSLVEINPLVVTSDGGLLALDAKLNLDDNALFRHRDYAELRDPTQEDELELEASKHNISYIKLDGDVGCMVNGAGLAMATMDIIKLMGAEPANFLDVGGGASEEMVTNAFILLLSDPKVKAALVNIFGGILRCDIVARGMIEASKQKEIKVPIVVRMRGTNVEEGMRLFAESGLPIILANDLKDAAEKVVVARGGAG
ncbi:MAG: ADP-forming succinate--CoA ligase subunit beta [Dehalococcoidia bacterium]|nr:MAG: ADP-forming succinate--CoA ligase subunit beta [Dehalococcoidia bacterium]